MPVKPVQSGHKALPYTPFTQGSTTPAILSHMYLDLHTGLTHLK